MASAEGYNLTKLISFMAKVVPDREAVTFFDNGLNFVMQITSADSMTVTAVLPTNGAEIEPLSMPKADLLKAYRAGAMLSGKDGKLNMRLNNWRMSLLGSVENVPPEPTVIEGDKVVIDVAPLKSVPIEDSYGGSTWAIFLPSGLATLCSTYSLVAVVMTENVWPKKPVTIQANAIPAMVNLVDPKLTVNEDAISVVGGFLVAKEVYATVHVALAKPHNAPPSPEQVEEQLPTKKHKLSVSAHDLRTCIEGAKKNFDEEATNLTFSLTKDGLAISLQTQTAALAETLAYVKAPSEAKGKIVINTDVAVMAFKGLRELTSGRALAAIRTDENAVYIRVTEDNRLVGALVIAASDEA